MAKRHADMERTGAYEKSQDSFPDVGIFEAVFGAQVHPVSSPSAGSPRQLADLIQKRGRVFQSLSGYDDLASDTITAAALGRPFTLGMLYDARQDELMPGYTLWDNTTLQENITETSQRSSEFQITASDSIDSKSSLLDVEASLKASFMSGLIEVGGSAKYLNDQKKSNNQSRVTFQYKATTNFKQLSMSQVKNLKTQQTDAIKNGLATHVVTGILYGANAFFVFDSEKIDASSVQEIQVSMEAVIKKVPSFHAHIKLTDEEKALTNKFSCKFYGDLILESNPATFAGAVKTYVELPKLLGETGENAVPLKVWLTPLKNLDPTAAEIKSEISVGLVSKAADTLEDLRQIEMRCNDSLEDRVSENFPQIRKTLSSFQKLCKSYTSGLQNIMKNKLPSIRGGNEDESSLENIFAERDKSPFSQELSKWMDHKEREINIISSCLDMMRINPKIVPNQSKLDREVLDPGVEDALCFVFTSLESNDPCLDAMSNHLDSPESESASEDHWYFSDEVLTEMRRKIKTFNDVAKALKNSKRFRFLVAALPNEKYTGATIYHYKDGKLVSDNFTQPDIPDVRAVKDRRDLIWYACDLTLDPDTANNYLNLSEKNKKVTRGGRQAYPDNPDRFDTQPQVLCKEDLHRRHYWEVEFSNGHFDDVGVAVTYKRIGRKRGSTVSRLGHNALSWYFGFHQGFQAWHDGKQRFGPLPAVDHNRIGVYLDWPAGTLSFYSVSFNTLKHLHTFNTTFTEHVYPAAAVWVNSNYVSLCRF
ncbi:stonustoxin subunit beta-like [Scomber japonicus]|uniref:stonustoxin subunit beta-like n=1 Tax=Scomber japonicus TaxID=13676 RepID=UPI0023061FAF|nr:stonustoxin subunit beta-like [Scomber japonicus]